MEFYFLLVTHCDPVCLHDSQVLQSLLPDLLYEHRQSLGRGNDIPVRLRTLCPPIRSSLTSQHTSASCVALAHQVSSLSAIAKAQVLRGLDPKPRLFSLWDALLRCLSRPSTSQSLAPPKGFWDSLVEPTRLAATEARMSLSPDAWLDFHQSAAALADTLQIALLSSIQTEF